MGSVWPTAVKGTIEHYREQATFIRAAAEQATDQEIKRELFKLAAAFERLAAERTKHPIRSIRM